MKVFSFLSVWLLVIFYFLSNSLAADAPEVPLDQPPAIGNFLLPASQTPGPLVGFGENIIDSSETQLFLGVDNVSGTQQHTISIEPTVLYGITDKFSILLNVPLAADSEQDNQHSAGLEDISVQPEYAWYTKENAQMTEQATIVANLTFPTGNSNKEPALGAGTPSFFLGSTFNRTGVTWFEFAAPGIIVTAPGVNTQQGNQWLYQLGIGKNIVTIDSSWIIATVVEGDGEYTEKNKIQGTTDNNTGGHVVELTPSLWVSSKKLILQLGVSKPIIQHLFGDQSKNSYSLVANLGWAFY